MRTLTTNLRKCCANCSNSSYELETAYSCLGGDVVMLTCDHLEVCKIINQGEPRLFDDESSDA